MLPASTVMPHHTVVGKLTTQSQIRRELVRLYRDCRTGRVETSDGSRLAFMLNLLAKMIEASDIERRIAAVEQQMQNLPVTRR